MTELRLWPTQSGPFTLNNGAANKTMATEFKVITGTWWLKELRFWRGAWDIIGPVYGQVYQVNSAVSGTAVDGTAVTFNLRGLGWQVATLPTPVLLTTGQTYRACYWSPFGASSTPNYW